MKVILSSKALNQFEVDAESIVVILDVEVVVEDFVIDDLNIVEGTLALETHIKATMYMYVCILIIINK